MLTSKKINDLIQIINNISIEDVIQMKILFKSYCEIENSYNSKYINKLINENKDNKKYVITEKIHGSNLGFHINLKTMDTYFSSRNYILNQEDNSMRLCAESVFRRIKPNISKIIENVKNELQQELDQYDILCIFGELFGGSYNHPDVQKDNDAIRIQKGIYYTSSNYFDAFDIALLRDKNNYEIKEIDDKIKIYEDEYDNCKDNSRKEIIIQNINTLKNYKIAPFIKYVNFDTFVNILKDSNIQIVPILKITDSLQEALQFNKVFESVVYKQFNLPKIENNFAEGVVIRPYKEEQLSNNKRVILKNKNELFSEIIHDTKKKNEKIDIVKSKETIELINLLDDYINENRLNSVLSKNPGPYTDKDFSKLMKFFTIDILDEFEKYNNDKIEKVKELDEYKLFTKALSTKAMIILKNKFKEIITLY